MQFQIKVLPKHFEGEMTNYNWLDCLMLEHVSISSKVLSGFWKKSWMCYQDGILQEWRGCSVFFLLHDPISLCLLNRNWENCKKKS